MTIQCATRPFIGKIRLFIPYLTVIIVTFAFRSAIADWNDIPSGSMEPTLLVGDRIFVNKLAYNLRIPFTMTSTVRWNTPERGDIVVFMSPADGRRLVKRVIGIPGDTVEMKNERLAINGQTVKLETIDRERFGGMLDDIDRTLFFRENLSGIGHSVMIAPDLPAMRSFGPVIVPERRYLVLGDNRDNSADSRYIGLIDEDRIVGKVTGVAFSLNHDEWYMPRKDRFFVKPDRAL